jgi:hypothetical protein
VLAHKPLAKHKASSGVPSSKKMRPGFAVGRALGSDRSAICKLRGKDLAQFARSGREGLAKLGHVVVPYAWGRRGVVEGHGGEVAQRARKSDREEGGSLERTGGGWLCGWHPRSMPAGEEEKERRRACKNQSPGPSRRASRPPTKKVPMRLAGGGWRRRRRTMSLCVVCVVCVV